MVIIFGVRTSWYSHCVSSTGKRSIKWPSNFAWACSDLLPVWRCMCFLKLDDCVNFFSQTLQLKVCSPEWMGIWLIKCDEDVKFLLQTLQLKGRSPEWRRMCVLKLDKCLNFFSQSLQVKGRSPEWTRMCSLKVVWAYERLFTNFTTKRSFS